LARVEGHEQEIRRVAIAVQILLTLLLLERQEPHHRTVDAVRDARITSLQAARSRGRRRGKHPHRRHVEHLEYRIAGIAVAVEISVALGTLARSEGDLLVIDHEVFRLLLRVGQDARARVIDLQDVIHEVTVAVQVLSWFLRRENSHDGARDADSVRLCPRKDP
jgi:hypothetical protein